ncbi:Glycosyl transferases group 1 [Caloramator quimbayensis]|uniref:Glycosyl transferases group 1 n=1 Tax=Caloramator quimbayensis TaxID=1147123 RepID=A0A1T4WQ70_9CLOT|nr:glycosyltransferase family 4 protein [Caloramator quimbayensis]SKA79504.1 Glycosyl transferases group 1 [Caloramator quimbayensis]
MIDYDKIRFDNFNKRINILAQEFYNKDIILEINRAIIDEDYEKADICKMKLELLNINYKKIEVESLKTKEKFDIAYLLPHNIQTGGLKVILNQANLLSERGHRVTLYSHLPKMEWFKTNCSYIQVKEDVELYRAVYPCDIVIAGYYDLIVDALMTLAPLKYYLSQGDFYIFEWEEIEPLIRNTAYTAYNLPVRILTVSNVMQRKIKDIFKRNSVKIPNAVDNNVFYPVKKRITLPFKILIVGSDSLKFKGHDDIIRALYELKEEGYLFKISWATQTIPSKIYYNGKLNIQYSISPTQDELSRLYRESDIYVSGSYYEAFSLPPLEAMSSGCCVVTSDNEGVKEYAIHNKNCIMYERGNIRDLKDKLKILFRSPALRRRLILNGINTAKNYCLGKSIDLLEEEFKKSKNNLIYYVAE